jgi:hypothetical protein
VGVLLLTLARLYDIQKRYDEAEKTLDQAYQILSQALGENHALCGKVFDEKTAMLELGRLLETELPRAVERTAF